MAGVDLVDEKAVVGAPEGRVGRLELGSGYVLKLCTGLALYGRGDSIVED